MKTLALLLAVAAVALADGAGRILSIHANADFPLTADPNAAQWKKVKGVFAENSPTGQPVPGHRTEIRSRWTADSLYLLFICPYQELNLKPDPNPNEKTNLLWEWDVAEAFIGTDLKDIRHYREFQVSPQSEWIDLDINRNVQPAVHDWQWKSGLKVKGRIDKEKKIWYGEMQIPMASIDLAKPAKGTELRVNLYRIQGPGPNRNFIAWQPTGAVNYHIPESFGRLVLK